MDKMGPHMPVHISCEWPKTKLALSNTWCRPVIKFFTFYFSAKQPNQIESNWVGMVIRRGDTDLYKYAWGLKG